MTPENGPFFKLRNNLFMFYSGKPKTQRKWKWTKGRRRNRKWPEMMTVKGNRKRGLDQLLAKAPLGSSFTRVNFLKWTSSSHILWLKSGIFDSQIRTSCSGVNSAYSIFFIFTVKNLLVQGGSPTSHSCFLPDLFLYVNLFTESTNLCRQEGNLVAKGPN